MIHAQNVGTEKEAVVTRELESEVQRLRSALILAYETIDDLRQLRAKLEQEITALEADKELAQAVIGKIYNLADTVARALNE